MKLFLVMLLSPGCWLERVTGAPVPLDPRFYEAVEKAQGNPGEGGGAAVPFGTWEGETVTVRGVVRSEIPDPIDIDVRTPDPDEPGGVKGQGKLMLDGPGPFSLVAPKGLGKLELQAFQDPDLDGPTGSDPFAETELEVGDSDLSDVSLVLEKGGREIAAGGTGPVHQEMPPGAPGGAPRGGAGPTSGHDQPFPDYDGRAVQISGTLAWSGQSTVDLDLFQPDPVAPGGRKMVAKLKRMAGPYSFEMPDSFGPLVIEAFIDEAGDGPGPGDPMGSYPGNPLVVGSTDVNGVDITLALTTDGKLPGIAPPPNEQGGALPPPP